MVPSAWPIARRRPSGWNANAPNCNPVGSSQYTVGAGPSSCQIRTPPDACAFRRAIAVDNKAAVRAHPQSLERRPAMDRQADDDFLTLGRQPENGQRTFLVHAHKALERGVRGNAERTRRIPFPLARE